MNNPALCIDVSKSTSFATGFLSYNNPTQNPLISPIPPMVWSQLFTALRSYTTTRAVYPMLYWRQQETSTNLLLNTLSTLGIQYMY